MQGGKQHQVISRTPAIQSDKPVVGLLGLLFIIFMTLGNLFHLWLFPHVENVGNNTYIVELSCKLDSIWEEFL